MKMPGQMRYAEEANYWATTVHPMKSQAEVSILLEEFGVANQIVAQGSSQGRYAWLVRFEWQERTYRFTFSPLECKESEKVSSFGGQRRSHEEQARYQMARIATHFTKAILTAAEAQPAALFGFLELPGMPHRGLPRTTAESNLEEIVGRLPPLLAER